MYELTKVIGPVDFTGIKVTTELKKEFLQWGHITLDDKGDDYDPSDIVGGPIALLSDGSTYELYAKIFDGPDNNLVKAHRLTQALVQSKQRFRFKVILGKTADGLRPKLRVALIPSPDQRNVVKVTPTLDLMSLPGRIVEIPETMI